MPAPPDRHAPSIADSALKGACPACGAPTLFDGAVRFADRCRACGLDYGQFNVGDGPAAFLTLVIGAVITLAAVLIDLAYSPPIWLHLLIWPVLTFASVVASLRVAKGALLAAEFRNAAREGRLVEEPKP